MERSLTDTFPFSLDLRNDVEVDRQAKQEDEPDVGFDAVAAAGVGAGGQEKRCVQKVVMEEQLVWEDVQTCDHSYNKRCHKSEITVYSSAQEEECNENYVKNCFIEYSLSAANVTVDVCRTPLVKDCEKEGEQICSTQYESECVTSQEKHEVEDDVPACQTEQEEKCEENTSGYTSSTACTKWPKEVCTLSKAKKTKFSPITKCVKVPVELCGPAGCGFKEGEQECIQKTQTIVSDKPKETCTLDPQRDCKHVTKLVPALREVERCVDVPKEVCVRSQRNPRKVAKPVIKNWCYKVKCPDDCRLAAREGKCLPECEEFKGDTSCCNPCPAKCIEAAKSENCLPQECKQWQDDPVCKCEGCSKTCKDAAAKGQCPRECKPKCCNEVTRKVTTTATTTTCTTTTVTTTKCPTKCVEAALIGFCPKDCKQFQGDANCCAPKCPPKCTSKRCGSCAATGVEECGQIPGCCPDLFDELYGQVSFEARKGREGKDIE